jgi:hypothetical protein
MIGKVDPKLFQGLTPSRPSHPSFESGASDFQALLENKLSKPQPLEIIVIKALSRMIEAALRTEEEHGFDESSAFVPIPFPPFLSQPLSTPFPVQPGSQPEPQVSNHPTSKSDSALSPIATPFPSKQKETPVREFDSTIRQAASRYDLDPALIRSVIQVESSGNPRAVSSAGAQGLMQLMPATAAELGVTDPFDPAQNIMAGSRYLKQLLDRYQGDTKLALAAYNWGMGNLEKRPDALPRETRQYISKVERLYWSQTETV